MKKSLLLSATALTCLGTASALPAAPKLLPDQVISSISPDGRYVEGSVDGSMTITDLETGKEYFYQGDGGVIYFSSGAGNCWSANGILVGNMENNGAGAYWQDGEWTRLPNPDNRNIFPKAINPDGTMICATATVTASDNAPKGMNDVALVWTLGEDGKWGDPITLPYPTEDFTGRAPQMVIPLVISDDGTKIIAQLVDYSGFFRQPMMYISTAEGWEYKYVAEDMINPEKLEFPAWDDDAPEPLAMQDFISDPEKKAEWEKLYQEWIDSQYSTTYPDPQDYLSYEDGVAYNEAVAEFNEKAEAYNEMLMAFMTVLDKVSAVTPSFSLNNMFMTGDATRLAMSASYSEEIDPSDPYAGFKEFTNVVVVNLTDGSHETFSLEGHDTLNVSAIASDGTVLAYTGEANSTAFIKQPGKDWENLYDYLVANADESSATWLKDNLLHTYDYMDPLSGESFSYVDEPFMERSCCTPNLKVITTCATNLWDFENDPTEYYSYVIPTPKASVGIGCITEAEGMFSLNVMKGGVIRLDSPADVYVYDMQGRLVYSAKGVDGVLNTGLQKGVYTVKAVSGMQTKTEKALF